MVESPYHAYEYLSKIYRYTSYPLLLLLYYVFENQKKK